MYILIDYNIYLFLFLVYLFFLCLMIFLFIKDNKCESKKLNIFL